MSITCSIDHDNRYMVAVATGLIDWEEVRTHLFAARLEGCLSYRELIDLRVALPPPWSSAQARETAALLTNLRRKSTLGPTAVVASSGFTFWLLRKLEIILEEVCIVKPFHDYETAEQWLLSSREPYPDRQTEGGAIQKSSFAPGYYDLPLLCGERKVHCVAGHGKKMADGWQNVSTTRRLL